MVQKSHPFCLSSVGSFGLAARTACCSSGTIVREQRETPTAMLNKRLKAAAKIGFCSLVIMDGRRATRCFGGRRIRRVRFAPPACCRGDARRGLFVRGA